MPTRWTSTLTWPAGLAVMLGLYAGVYFALVSSNIWEDETFIVVPSYVLPGEVREFPHANSSPTGFRARFFDPIHFLDRRIRPSVWEIDHYR